MSDKRQTSRYAIELDAIVEVANTPIAARTCDISRGGFCLMSAEFVQVHTPCTIRLALVFSETEFSEYLLLTGTIVWCTRLKGAYQVGVKFTDLSPANKNFLDLFIRFLEAPGDELDNQRE